ncbi:MAG: replication-associated recombination protein A [Bacilli bacterium]|nr:replication-associated recombination protein A [Bacilli bacterium]
MELLANKLRPTTLSEVLGQEHLIGPNKILTNLINNQKLFSLILYGPPGTGKTSIAEAIVKDLNKNYRLLNAVINNKADFDVVIEEAKMFGELILIIDEIHRMNKDKQDMLLPYIENGLIIIIGLTTANPYHSINPAIRSRCQIFEITPLTPTNIIEGLKRASKYLDKLEVSDDVLEMITSLSSGDLRSALNILEMAYYSTNGGIITKEVLQTINSKPVVYIDKNDTNYYDTISALQKSIRGSDVQAALYYLAILLEAEDLDIIFRRLTVIAYEDIGLANPGIGPKVISAIEAVKLLGLPEGRIPLSVVVVEMALSPKSNSAYLGIENSINEIRKGNVGKVPKHLKNNSKEYKYPHNYKNYWVNQQYLPDEAKDKKFYIPKVNTYENNLNKINEEMRKCK